MKFLIITLTGWEEPPRARHQVSNALVSLGHEVVFVAKNKVGRLKLTVKNINKSLKIIEPFFPLNYRFRYRLPLINEYYQKWLFSRLRSEYSDYEVINFDFTAHLLSAYFKRYIYYCNDHYIGNSRYPNILVNTYHEYCERKVTRNAAFCISTASFITDRLGKYNKNVFDIPLGGPEINYKQIDPNKSVKKVGPIMVGLVGFISTNNMSYKLINSILNENDMRLAIIGPIDGSFLEKVNNQKDNLIIKGILTHNDLYNAINNFDVCIAPYDLKRINPGTTPNKMWQYLALGKPVVVSNLKNLNIKDYPEKLIYVALSDDEFVPSIRQAHFDNTPELIDLRIKLSLDNTWKKKIEGFLKIRSEFFIS